MLLILVVLRGAVASVLHKPTLAGALLIGRGDGRGAATGQEALAAWRAGVCGVAGGVVSMWGVVVLSGRSLLGRNSVDVVFLAEETHSCDVLEEVRVVEMLVDVLLQL